MGQREPTVEVASKVSGEEAGRTVQGSGAGRSGRICGRPWCLGKASFCTPHVLQTHPCLVPPGHYHLSHLPHVQCPEKGQGSGRIVSCFSFSCHSKTKWATGSSPAPSGQGQGSHLWADVTAGLQPDPESVFIPAP